jgi:hypothetical protein
VRSPYRGRHTTRVTDWATHFYEDLLHIEACEFQDTPTRFWLITFAHPATKRSIPPYYQTEVAAANRRALLSAQSGLPPPQIILPDLVTAVSLILDMIKDFDFVTESDKSRCVA